MEQITNERGIVLTRHSYYQLIHTLWRALPPPMSDHPDDLVRRDNAAMAEVASLLPADPAEAAIAGQFVAACAHAMDCLRLVQEHAADPKLAMKCRAQAVSMMRQACSARSLLMRVQEARRKRAASDTKDPEWSDHGILDRMTEALRRAPTRASKAATEAATAAEPTEPAFSVRDEHPAADSAQADEMAEDVLPVQTIGVHETVSKNHALETFGRLDSPASPIDDMPGPHAASRPPHHPDERPEAPSGQSSAGFVPSKPALGLVTDAMN